MDKYCETSGFFFFAYRTARLDIVHKCSFFSCSQDLSLHSVFGSKQSRAEFNYEPFFFSPMFEPLNADQCSFLLLFSRSMVFSSLSVRLGLILGHISTLWSCGDVDLGHLLGCAFLWYCQCIQSELIASSQYFNESLVQSIKD